MSTPDTSRLAVERAVAFGLIAAVGGFAFVESFGYGWFNEGHRIGPGLLPGVLGGLVLVVALALLVSGLRSRTPKEHGLAEIVSATTAGEGGTMGSGGGIADDEPDIFGRTAAQRLRQLQMVTVAVIVALLAVPALGLLVAMFLFCLFVSIVVERRPWLPSVVVNGLSVAAIWGVFGVFLEVPLPAGYLGIGG